MGGNDSYISGPVFNDDLGNVEGLRIKSGTVVNQVHTGGKGDMGSHYVRDIVLPDAQAMSSGTGDGLLGEVEGPIEIDILSGDLLPICLGRGVVWKRHGVLRVPMGDKGG